MHLQIIIVTRGRIDKQLTLQALPPEPRKLTTIVCPAEEVDALARLYPGIAIEAEPHPMRLADKRGWIVKTWYRRGYSKIIMLDDDLRFATRKRPNDWHLGPITGNELILEFERIEDKLGPEYPHVGFDQRLLNNFKNGGWEYVGKMCTGLAYYLPIVAKVVRWDEIELRQDYSATLQLFRKGYPNAIWTRTVVDQDFGAPGGCSIYRPEMEKAEAEKFAARYPDFVSAVYKEYERGSRWDVEVEWKKACKYCQEQRAKDQQQIEFASPQ